MRGKKAEYEHELVSCDTFVVMPDLSGSGEVIFGKNSDRPKGEVQEVVFHPAQKYDAIEKLKCTYIDIDQATETLAVILSKPAWMWGAEMGANSEGVVIGNEAVWNILSDPDHDLVSRLLGMDLLRLGLERGRSAREALHVITDLLARHGQGGQCSDIVPDFSYHNSFLIADRTEAWVLETADTFWVAERVSSGVRNISNCLSVTTQIDLSSDGLQETARARGWWDGETTFNWSQVMGGGAQGSLTSPDTRWRCGTELLRAGASQGQFSVETMMGVLRDEESGINRPGGEFPTAGSQVSTLGSTEVRPCHWFTATPGPARSVFKPFVFGSMNQSITPDTKSPEGKQLLPQERKHKLWSLAEKEIFKEEKLKILETWSVEKGLQERLMPEDDIENIFDISVKRELEIRK